VKNGRPAILEKSLLFSLFFFTFSFELLAQNSGYFYDSISGETRFIQRLTWTEDEYARRYEVIIEKENEGEYRGLFQEFTTALFIQVFLLPGKYRCRVITHDFLNRPGPAPEWKHIEVLAAPNPEAVNYEQAHLEQARLTDDIELVLKTGDAKPVADTQVNLFFGAAWMPSFTVSDRGNRFFGADMSFAGVAGRFGVVWANPNFFNPGAELAVSYNSFGTDGQGSLLAFTLNLSSLNRLPGDRTALTFRLGAGDSVLPNDGAAHANMGVSFLLFVMKSWYLETGLDYAQMLPAPSSGCFRPWVGVVVSSW
jgi:hypothetical protein